MIGSKPVLPNWRVRYAYDKVNGKAFEIVSEVGIDKRTVKPIEGGIYSKELGNIVDTDKSPEDKNYCLEEKELNEDFGTDLNKYGWIVLNENDYVIVPNAYEMIKSVVGNKNLEKILRYQISIGIEGNAVKLDSKTRTIPYQNIGMKEFKKKFEEIMNYYGMLKPKKFKKAQFLIKNKQRVFTNVIPVYNSLLRPAYSSSKKKMFSYDKLNALLTAILSNVKMLKNGSSKRLSNGGDLLLLWSVQESLQEFYHMTISTKISGKYKLIRNNILSTRTSFSSRAVITSLTDPKYIGMDHVVVNYKQFIEIYTLLILNCMMRGIGDPKFKYMTVYELLTYLKKAKYSQVVDEKIYFIMEYLINNHKQGLWTVLNRNPTIDLGSQQTLKIVHVIKDANSYVMQLPITSLASQTADFDGDVENLFSLTELQVVDAFVKGYSPRYLLLDRTGDNLVDTKFLPIKDSYTVINSFAQPLRG